MVQLSFYLHACIAQFTFEVKRSDFVQMLAHHIVTSFLIGVSYAAGYVLILPLWSVFFLHLLFHSYLPLPFPFSLLPFSFSFSFILPLLLPFSSSVLPSESTVTNFPSLLNIYIDHRFTRIGGLVLFLHDVNDILLEGGKMLIYAGWNTLSNSA